jgi:hydroxypyruvate isomerase
MPFKECPSENAEIVTGEDNYIFLFKTTDNTGFSGTVNLPILW